MSVISVTSAAPWTSKAKRTYCLEVVVWKCYFCVRFLGKVCIFYNPRNQILEDVDLQCSVALSSVQLLVCFFGFFVVVVVVDCYWCGQGRLCGVTLYSF